MTELTFVRHGEPIRTNLHHCSWGVEEDCPEDFDVSPYLSSDLILHSGLQRSKDTFDKIHSKAIFQNFKTNTKDFEVRFLMLGILNEIEKGLEKGEEFELRVRFFLENLLPSQLKYYKKIFICSHNRFMCVAHEIITGKPHPGFNYWEMLELEI